MKEEITTMAISKNMARALKIIKNTQEYRSIKELLLDPNFHDLLTSELNRMNNQETQIKQ